MLSLCFTLREYFSSLVIVRFASSFCHQMETSVTSALSTAQSKDTSSPSRTILRVSAAVVGSTCRANRGDTCCPSMIVRLTPAAIFGSHVHRRDPRFVRIQGIGQHFMQFFKFNVGITQTFHPILALGQPKRKSLQWVRKVGILSFVLSVEKP